MALLITRNPSVNGAASRNPNRSWTPGSATRSSFRISVHSRLNSPDSRESGPLPARGSLIERDCCATWVSSSGSEGGPLAGGALSEQLPDDREVVVKLEGLLQQGLRGSERIRRVGEIPGADEEHRDAGLPQPPHAFGPAFLGDRPVNDRGGGIAQLRQHFQHLVSGTGHLNGRVGERLPRHVGEHLADRVVSIGD